MKKTLGLIAIVGALAFVPSVVAASSTVTLNLNMPNIQFDPATMERIDYTWTTDQFSGGQWTSAAVIEHNCARGWYSYTVTYLDSTVESYSDTVEIGNYTVQGFDLIFDANDNFFDLVWKQWGGALVPGLTGEFWSAGSGLLASCGLYGFWASPFVMSYATGDTSVSSSTDTITTTLATGAVHVETVERSECVSSVSSWYTYYGPDNFEASSLSRGWLPGLPQNGLKRVVTGSIQMPQ